MPQEVTMTEITDDEPWHGTNYGYMKRKCKCARCRAWWSAWFSAYKERRQARTGEAFSGRLGGFVPGMPCGCGCGQPVPLSPQPRYRRGHKAAATTEKARLRKHAATPA
jgi:hypothetical protein